MVLNEWMGFANRFLHCLLCLCHWQKHLLLGFPVSLLWLLDSAFDGVIYAQATTKRGRISAMVYGLGRP